MKKQIPEEVMHERRIERLNRLNFFMKDKRAGGIRTFALHETHNLLTGFFQNSKWQTAWFCFKYALRNSYTTFLIDCRFFYYYKVLRLTSEQVEARMDARYE